MGTLVIYSFLLLPSLAVIFILYFLVSKFLIKFSFLLKFVVALAIYLLLGVFFLTIYFVPDQTYGTETELLSAFFWPSGIPITFFKIFD